MDQGSFRDRLKEYCNSDFHKERLAQEIEKKKQYEEEQKRKKEISKAIRKAEGIEQAKLTRERNKQEREKMERLKRVLCSR